MLQFCHDCERFQFYPRAICTSCNGSHISWQALVGTGQIYSYTVVHRAPSPRFSDAAPYVVALIELDEGVRMLSNVVEATLESLRIGLRVKVVFEEISPGTNLPLFQPVEDR